MPDILSGEYAENEIRKDFTASERVAILETIQTKSRGGDQSLSPNLANADEAAKKSGLGNRTTAKQAKKVVKNAIPEIVEKMDSGEISISAAANIADLPEQEQKEIVQQVKKDIVKAAKKIRTADTHVGKNSGENEWHTPPEYIDAARILSAAGEVRPRPLLTGATARGSRCIYPAGCWQGCL